VIGICVFINLACSGAQVSTCERRSSFLTYYHGGPLQCSSFMCV